MEQTSHAYTYKVWFEDNRGFEALSALEASQNEDIIERVQALIEHHFEDEMELEDIQAT